MNNSVPNSTHSSIAKLLLPVLTAIGLSACGGSSSSNTTNSSTTIQIYNASANSSAITLSVDDSSLLTNISFSDASTTYDITSAEYEVSISANDANGDQQDIIVQTLKTTTDQHNLFVLSGDFSQPSLNQYVINFPTLETDEISLVFTSFSDIGSDYGVYIGIKDQDFEQAQFIGNLSQNDFSDAQTFIENDFIIYLTDANDEVVFESQSMALYWQNTYLIALRDHFGPGEPALAVDVITTSTTVNSYNDVNAEAEFRVINSYAGLDAISYTADASNGQQIAQSLPYNQASSFNEVDFGDFQLSLSDSNEQVLINNMLFTLNQNETKTVVLYSDEVGDISGTIIEQDVRPRAFEHELTLFNSTFDYADVDYYFVGSDTTIETTPYHISSVEFEEIKQFILPDGDYQIKVVHEDEQNNLTLLYQSEAIAFTQSNYMMILQKDPSSDYGYQLKIVE